MKNIILLTSVLMLAGCSMGSDDSSASCTALAWADAYFNCNFVEAAKHATPESEKWLRFAASNIVEDDLQLLRDNPVEIDEDADVTYSNDTLRVVSIDVKNFLVNRSVDEPKEQADEGTFLVNVVKRNGQWAVRMEGLPRSGKQSPD